MDVAHANWNNAPGRAGTTTDITGPLSGKLVDDSGSDSLVAITWANSSANTTWRTNFPLNDGDDKMMKGYVDLGNSTPPGVTITVSNLNQFASGYDVYLYAARAGGAADASVSNGTTTYGMKIGLSTSSSFPADYALADTLSSEPSTTWDIGNYVLFENMSGDSFTITYARLGPNSGVTGMQIVPVPEPDPLQLWITATGANPGNYDFTWESLDGKLYDLVSSTDLSTPIGTWPVWEGHADIAGTAPTNTLPDVPGGGPTRFFAVIEKDPPPLLGENFDAGPGVPGGWTAADNAAGTAWEVGDPSTGPAEGPDAAVSGAHCAGTNIVANYTAGADATLTSPAIEVPAGGATLSFQQYIDTDGSGDVGAVRLLDAGNADAEIIDGAFPVTSIEGIEDGWTGKSFPFPPAALGKTVKVQFQFVSDGDTEVFSGFYIDDVEMTTP
ncbi:MAG: choice-of-anchor J domain-containing protein [Verrucomicrobia bacterium]|nr:choice-of-anchor J domain-containing protein [Verrucomicrobiota bacterium]